MQWEILRALFAGTLRSGSRQDRIRQWTTTHLHDPRMKRARFFASRLARTLLQKRHYNVFAECRERKSQLRGNEGDR